MTITDKEAEIIGSCLTLPSDMAEATDFKAEEAIKIDMSVKLPESYSLGQWIYTTSNQGSLGACTSLGTTHATQILNVKKNGVLPTTANIITPDRKDLRSKMGHSTTVYDGGDYVEKAVSTALKEGIKTVENGSAIKFDGYAYGDWDSSEYDKDIDMMKRYLYNGNPIVWCVQGDKKMWNEMSDGEVVTRPATISGGHCIALVGYDAGGFWFINSRRPNDPAKHKSRFYVSFDNMKKIGARFNRRYWILYVKADAKVDPEYLKRKNTMKLVLEVLKKQYDNEPAEVKNAIVNFSQAIRKNYPEINQELKI